MTVEIEKLTADEWLVTYGTFCIRVESEDTAIKVALAMGTQMGVLGF